MKRRVWQEFPVGPSGSADRLHVTLDRSGSFLIGANTYKRFGEPEAVVLLFDPKNHTIGLAPASHHTPNGYPLIEKHNGRHRILRANLFCRHYGIRVERTAAFGTAWIDEDGVLVLELRSLVGIGKVGNGKSLTNRKVSM